MYCSKCGAQLAPQAVFCVSCGTHTEAAETAVPGGPTPGAPSPGVPPSSAPSQAIPTPGGGYAYLPPYWQAVFQKFDVRPGQMQTHWNWPAFFFGAFWYLVKGMPAKAAIYFVVSLVTYGAGWLFLAIYAGLYGAWDYYLKEVKGKQLW